MNQKEHILQFNRQLDRLLSGKAMDISLSPSDQRKLGIARRLSLANFSSESCVRDELYLRLIKYSAIGIKSPIVHLPRRNFSTWAWTAIVLMVLLAHSIDIPSPQPGYIAMKLPADVVMYTPSPSVTITSGMNSTQTLKPIPIPTPMVILRNATVQDQPILALNSRAQSSSINLDQTLTPKPEPLPHPDVRP